MSKAEIAYLVAVVVFAGAFGASVFAEREGAAATAPAASRVRLRTRTRAREVDLHQLRQLIKAGRLSGREAEFYRAVAPDADLHPGEGEERARTRTRRRTRGGRGAHPEDRAGVGSER